MDPLSDVLSLLKLRSYVSGGFNAAGAWAVEFGEHEGIKFHAVVEGSCWVSVDGASAVRIGAGECFLLPRGKPFVIASDLCVQPIPAQTVLSSTRDGRIVTYNQGGEFLSVGGYCTLADQQADLLLKMLPPIIHIREAPDSATVRWCIERMAQELRNPQPGEFLVAQQLATLVLVQTLRLYLSDPQHARVGWLFALADKRMRAAIAAMHADPARHWTLRHWLKSQPCHARHLRRRSSGMLDWRRWTI